MQAPKYVCVRARDESSVCEINVDTRLRAYYVAVLLGHRPRQKTAYHFDMRKVMYVRQMSATRTHKVQVQRTHATCRLDARTTL